MSNYDLVVIGAGPGGYVAAIRGAQKGLKTAVIECRDVGGTCLNRGCIPTKSLVHSSHLYKEMQTSDLFGVYADNARFDFDKVNTRKNDIVNKLRSGTEQLLKLNKVDVIRGKGSIKDKNTVIAETDEGRQVLTAKNIIIATGSSPTLLPEHLQKLKNIYTSDDALAEDAKLFKRVLISGGGVIGVEFASIYRDFGCEVTIVGSRENLLRRLDNDISQNIMMLFKRRGINVITPAKITDIKEENGELRCFISQKDVEKEVVCDAVLVCIGRKPLTHGLFEDGFSVDCENGFVKVNEHMQTNIDSIYAIGDVTLGSTQLAHAASAEGLYAVSHMIGEKPEIDLKTVPGCVYTSPEIATVGLSADEAQNLGIKAKTGKFMTIGNGKSMITNEDRGFVKLVFEAETGIIIGAHLMCARATDIISELTTAIVNKLTAEDLANVIRPHPTYVESVTEAVEDVFGLAVHIAPKKK